MERRIAYPRSVSREQALRLADHAGHNFAVYGTISRTGNAYSAVVRVLDVTHQKDVGEPIKLEGNPTELLQREGAAALEIAQRLNLTKLLRFVALWSAPMKRARSDAPTGRGLWRGGTSSSWSSSSSSSVVFGVRERGRPRGRGRFSKENKQELHGCPRSPQLVGGGRP